CSAPRSSADTPTSPGAGRPAVDATTCPPRGAATGPPPRPSSTASPPSRPPSPPSRPPPWSPPMLTDPQIRTMFAALAAGGLAPPREYASDTSLTLAIGLYASALPELDADAAMEAVRRHLRAGDQESRF